MECDILHDKSVVDGDDVDLVDTLGFELVVELNVARYLGMACASESTGNADLGRNGEFGLSWATGVGVR